MLELFGVLPKYFRINRGDDNLPILARPLPGRDHGRTQLAKLMNDMGYRSGIEIGAGEGVSAIMWCNAMPGLDLTCIDPYVGETLRTQRRHSRYYARAKANAKKHGFKLLRLTSMEAVDRFADESVDFVHIDGNHTFDFVAPDIIRYVPKVRKGGMVLVHDYCAFEHGGVMKAVDGYTHCHHIDPWYVTRDCNPIAFWVK